MPSRCTQWFYKRRNHTSPPLARLTSLLFAHFSPVKLSRVQSTEGTTFDAVIEIKTTACLAVNMILESATLPGRRTPPYPPSCHGRRVSKIPHCRQSDGKHSQTWPVFYNAFPSERKNLARNGGCSGFSTIGSSFASNAPHRTTGCS